MTTALRPPFLSAHGYPYECVRQVVLAFLPVFQRRRCQIVGCAAANRS